ncbi:MAG TPA: molybdenum cofactor biosysynthesis protein [Opitutaceae bacterium]|nr:molybdenum cofactor biosysynthesis protein [Opitutaceae bacterium]
MQSPEPTIIGGTLPATVVIEHLIISCDHNYFGHHGRPAGSSPIMEVGEIECVSGRGIRGDRFFDYRPDYKGQITFFAMEVFEKICAELNLTGIPATAVRRNVFTRGLELNTLIGREFTVQGVRFFGAEECRPCYWMEQAIAPGTEARLRGVGGLRARIRTDGHIRLGPADLRIEAA